MTDSCEYCEADDVCIVVEVFTPDPKSTIGEGDTWPHLLCAGADCRSRVAEWADREGGIVRDVYLAQPAYLTPDEVAA